MRLEGKEVSPINEFRYLRRDNRILWLQTLVVPIIYQGRPAFQNAVLDITEQKQAQEALRESEQKYSLLFEMSAVPAALLKLPETVIVDANQAMEKLIGYSKEEMLGKTAVELGLSNLETRTQAMTNFQQDGALHGVEIRGRTKAGEERLIILNTNALALGGEHYAISTMQDITERKRAEAEVESLAKFPLENPNPVLRIMADGTLVYANPNSQPLLAHWQCEVGQKIPAPYQKILAESIQDQQPKEVEISAKESYFSLTFAPVAESGYANGYARDITKRKLAEMRIQQQIERLSALHMIDVATISSFDVKIILDIVLEQALKHLKVDASTILLYKPLLQTIEHGASRGFQTDAIRRIKLHLGEGYAGHALIERKTIHISNVMEQESNLSQALQMAGERFKDYFGVPLIVKGELKGVLEIFHGNLINPDPEWLEFLETLGHQVAVAIDNAQMFDSLQRSKFGLEHAYDETIEGWSRALDLRDKETEGHSRRVTEKSIEIARRTGLSDQEIVHLRRGALLHDIGKMGIPDSILFKPGELTEEEWIIMRMHPIYAYEMLSPIAYLHLALDIPYCHHEKWDGTGYPRGLKGEEIPLSARIFAVVDVWDALCSDRPYRPRWPQQKVRAHIQSLRGTHFDPMIVDIFLNMLDEAV